MPLTSSLPPRLDAFLTEECDRWQGKADLLALAGSWRRWQEGVGKAPHLLYFVHYPLPHIFRQSLALRAQGWKTSLLAFCLRPDLEAHRFFDWAAECPDYRTMGRFLGEARPPLVQAVTFQVAIPLLAVKHAPESRRVVELYDTHYYYWPDFPERIEYESERYALERCHGYIHKLPRPAAGELAAHYRLAVPGLQFHSFPCDAFLAPAGERKTNPSAPPRLVFTGGIIPPERAHELGHTNHLWHDLIRELARSGIPLTLFANQNARDMKWRRQREYFALARECPTFRFRAGRPVHRIARLLSGYDYGFFYDHVAGSRHRPEHFRYSMGTKFFSYLEAGLPLLIYRQAEYMTDLVRRHKIGVVYDADRVEELSRVLKEAPYEDLRRSVIKARQRWNLANFAPILTSFLAHVRSGANCAQDFYPLEEA